MPKRICLRGAHRSRISTGFSWLWIRIRVGSPLRFLCLLTMMLAVLTLSNVLAQKKTQGMTAWEDGARPPTTFAVHVDEVDLAFVVTDRHHRSINDLSERELRLRDNGQPPESIRTFESQTGLPLRLGLVVDVSDSIAPQFQFERNAAAMFIRRIVDSTKDLAFVLGFNENPALIQDLTGDTQLLASAIQNLPLGGGTAIYDAIYFACQRLLQQTDAGLTRRVLVVVTDGQDNSSHLSPTQVIENAIRCNVMVIVLHTQAEPDKTEPNYRVLQKLTRETGGQILAADTEKQMAKAFMQLSSQLRNYYLLAYHPAQFNRDGAYRKIQLQTTRRGAHIICRRGYYASVGANAK